MSGGITQLVAIGAQDAHLTGDPEVSFFRSIYKRHTNFSHNVERQVIQGNPSEGSISTVRFERKGDLLGYVYLTEKNGSTTVSLTADSISKVELIIGGQVIDEHTDDFTQNIADPYLVSSVTKDATTPDTFYPLHFWFCENFQSALPLVALQYHDVEIRITWGSGVDVSHRYDCFANYIYLDTNERKMLSDNPQNIIMYQAQRAIGVSGRNLELNFNHPIKFLAATENLVSADTTSTLKLQINGVDISDEKTYTPNFNVVPVYFHCPYISTNVDNSPNRFLYPFCLDTNKLQPTGSLNFSRLDSARIVTSTDMQSVDVYGVNYNILRVQNGMGGLLYAN